MLQEGSTESQTLPRDELKARALTRVALLTAAGIALFAGLVAVSLSTRPFEYFTASVNFVGLAIYLLLLYLQHRGRSRGARIAMLLVSNLHLTLLLVFYGWEAGVYMYFFLMIAVPFAIFSRQQKALITPMACLAVAMLIGVYVYYGVFEMRPLVIRDTRGIMVNMFTNLSGVSIASILLMRHMRNVHFQAEDGLEQEHRRSEELLLNVLPASIAERLKQGEKPIADDFSEVSILFADIVGFTELSGRMQARDLVDLLNEIFSDFDRLADEHGLEKIKTIGDCYMVVAGLPQPRPDHAVAMARMAFAMQAKLAESRARRGHLLQIRVGIHSGPVVAGVIGHRKFTYDLWGDAVNTASRMESHGAPGEITVSSRTFELVREKYNGQERAPLEIKGKGVMTTWFLLDGAS